jgi:hypothetical protein
MLARQGIIGKPTWPTSSAAWRRSSRKSNREFDWNLDDEDVHLNIEKRLTALVGDAGKRLHTGRSRNDQVATDIRLWLRDEIDILARLTDFQSALLDLAEPARRHPDARLHPPAGGAAGHLRPPPAGLFEMAARDRERLPTAASASTACRWVPPRWPAPPTRSTASSSPEQLGFDGSAPTRSTPSATATSPSNSAPPQR